MAQVTAQTKKWWQSKIVALGATLIAVFGGNLVLGFAGAQGITPEQVEAIGGATPQVVELIERVKGGESILNLIGLIGGIAVTIARVWFTEKLLPQSVK